MAPHEQLKAARQKAGLTQKELAEKLGVNEHWISKRETGNTELHHADVTRIANALDLEDTDVLRLHGRAA